MIIILIVTSSRDIHLMHCNTKVNVSVLHVVLNWTSLLLLVNLVGKCSVSQS